MPPVKTSKSFDKPLRSLIKKKKAKVLVLAAVENKVKIFGDKHLVSLAKNSIVKVEDVIKDLILIEQNDKDFEYDEVATNFVSLPRTSVKIRSESWTKITARETLKKYMKIFNLGRGMPLHYQVKENKPDGWPDSISFEDFKGVSFAKKEEATQIIEAMIRYHARVEPDTYFEQKNNNEDTAESSEDENLVPENDQNVENVENVVHVNNEEFGQQDVYQPNNQYVGHEDNNMPLHLDPSGQWYWHYYMQQWYPYYPQMGDGHPNNG